MPDDVTMDQVGEWISTVGTLVATAIALFLLWQGQQDRRALREETRRNQASRVTCWCEWSPDTHEGESGHKGVPAIFVRNMSEQSVYGVFVDYYHPEHGLERIDIGPVPLAKLDTAALRVRPQLTRDGSHRQ